MSNWQKVTLDKLCFFEKGKTGLAKAIPGDYPLVTTSAERKTNDSYQFDTKAVCIPLVSSTGHGHASLNYVHYQEGKFALGTILVALTPKDETILNAQFLHLYLSRLKDIILVPLMSGAANVSLSISKIKTVEIPLPPIDEQLKIVELFKNLVNENNELVEEINTQQSLLKQLKQTILQEAIEGKLTAKWRAKNPDIGTAKELLGQIKTEKEKLVKDKKIKPSKPLAPINEDEIPFDIPQSWEWQYLQNVSLNIHYGFNASANHEKKDVRLLRITDIQDNLVNWTTVPGCEYTKKDLTAYSLNENDILIARTGGTIGKSYIVKDLTVVSLFASYLIRVIPSQNIYADFLKFFIESPLYWKQLYDAAWGAGQPNVNGTSLSKLLLPLPPLEEQKEIVATIDKLFAICDELESEIKQNKTTVDNLMATVLKEAFEN